jgi:hypothetical protein
MRLSGFSINMLSTFMSFRLYARQNPSCSVFLFDKVSAYLHSAPPHPRLPYENVTRMTPARDVLMGQP